MSPPQERVHEGRLETVAAASTTAIYQAQYATVTTSKLHFSVANKTPGMSTIELYAKRQAEVMSISDKETPQKSNVSPPVPRVVPSTPPFLAKQSNVVESKTNTWICHGCDEEVSNSKKRCKCGCWKGGVRGPMKKQTKMEVPKAPNYNKKKAVTSNAKRIEPPAYDNIFGTHQVDASTASMVVIGEDLPACSPLTGNNSYADDDATDDESKNSLSNAARQWENDIEVLVRLNERDANDDGDGGDLDIDGEGEEVVQSFIDSMVEVELE